MYTFQLREINGLEVEKGDVLQWDIHVQRMEQGISLHIYAITVGQFVDLKYALQSVNSSSLCF